MQHVKTVTIFALSVMALWGCEERFMEPQGPTTRADKVLNPPSEGNGGFTPNPGGQSLPYPTIIKQTFVPENELFAYMKCLTWRIEWPNYPSGTDENKIPTVFTLSNGALNSFDYLNGVSAATTYKANFNLYHNAKLETANTLWNELTYTFGAGNQMETTWFNKTNYSAKTIEDWVKKRPSLFKSYWVDNNQEPPTYQQGDIFLFRLTDQNRYGGIRIVSMTPRIIEVYLAVPNN
ncbi:hypothetical protein [Spirosoma spitsbergense]|uniref:hypothetical protein n=1 Tax=Spirosoma spitsbergense TaxID=431554 RepID=UPI0003AB25CD|nr:hypothetical protein [Spirosoma spitsbergense]